MSRKITHSVMAAALSVGMLGEAIPTPAATPGLAMIQTNAKVSLNACIDNAALAMRQQKFDNIKIVGSQVSGAVGDYAVAILCYPITTSRELVLQSIIVAGPSTAQAEKLRDALEQVLDKR